MMMYIRTIIFTLFFILALTIPGVLADQGKVLKVVDGDTFLAEVQGKGGAETIEINLRCSDAPLVSSYFGKESKLRLEELLGKSALVTYKIQAYCGSESCVEALVYIPDENVPEITYINTSMIQAGMARNNSCRGVFEKAEAQAKSAKKGIWSTTKRIAFTDVKKAAPKVAATVTTLPVQKNEMAPAVVKYDRVERTVTIKSQKVSLTRIVKALDAVAPAPIKIYLQKEQFLALNLEKIHWYDALQRIVVQADLKQVNMDGKIDLYTRLFYYKHVAPYLKIAGNVGVYMSASNSVPKQPVKDDGTTRYVFINEFENSAEVAQQYKQTKERNQSSGFIQIHEGSSQAPVSDYGTFAKSGTKVSTAVVAKAVPVKTIAADPKPVKSTPIQPPVVQRAPLQAYSGEQEKVVVAEEKPVETVHVPTDKPVQLAPVIQEIVQVASTEKQPAAKVKIAPAEKPESAPGAAAKNVVAKEMIVSSAVKPSEVSAPSAIEPQATPTTEQKTNPVESGDKGRSDSAIALEFNLSQAAALVLIILVIVLGCFYLTKTAGAKAAKAEEHIEPEDLEEKEEDFPIDADAQVDKEYEDEIFDQLDNPVSESDKVDSTGNIFDAESSAVTEPENLAENQNDTAVKDEVNEPKEGTEKAEKPRKKLKTKLADEGNFSVPVDDYHNAMTGPKREPRKICLFEVKCNIDDNTFTGIGLDISSGGLFVDSKEQFGIGKIVEMEFRLFEDVENSLRCRGAITWYNQRPDPIKPDYPNGFGVRFLEIEDATVAAIEEYLKPEDDAPGFIDQIEKTDS